MRRSREDKPLNGAAAEAPAEAPKVLVLDRRGDLASDVATAAADLEPAPKVLRVAKTGRAVDAAGSQLPDVIVAGPDEMTHAGMRRLAQIHRMLPRTVILLTPNGSSPVSLKETAASGVSDVITHPSHPGRLRTTIRRALDTAVELRAERVVVHEPVGATAPLLAPVAQHMMTVTSPTGGCGKTFFATNLAAYLKRATDKRILLVDLDLQFGEVAVSLRIRPQRTISELVEENDIAEALPHYVVSHEAGYDVLCAPEDPIAAERIGPREVTAVLDAARSLYDFVVVDTPPSLNEVVLAAFDRSSSLIVMATMDVPSLRNLRVFLSTLERLKLETEDVHLVLNKEERGTGLDRGRVEKIYPQKFAAVLPYASEVTRSLNLGKPVVITAPGSDISRQFVECARRLVPPTVDGFAWPGNDAGHGSLLARLFGRNKKGASR